MSKEAFRPELDRKTLNYLAVWLFQQRMQKYVEDELKKPEQVLRISLEQP